MKLNDDSDSDPPLDPEDLPPRFAEAIHDALCHLELDRRGVPQFDGGKLLSLLGRIVRIPESQPNEAHHQ